MNINSSKGFSLIELLLVMVIIGILATITFPFLYSAKQKAENVNAFATMKVMISSQIGYFSQKGRFARLDELNASQADTLGTVTAGELTRGKFTFRMTPPVPTDTQLRTGYTITATKSVSGSELPYVVSIDQTGYTTPIFP